jgi:hypothetical protein
MTLIITTSMGRLAHLKQSLPTWLEHTDARILVVDYACPDGTARAMAELGSDRVIPYKVPEVLVATHSVAVGSSEPVFSKPIALNQALRRVGIGAVGDAGQLVFLDADTLIPNDCFWDIVTRLNPGRMLVADPSHATRDQTGVLVVGAAALLATGGYDEGMIGWGSEDLDVRIRLYLAGIVPEWFPPGLLGSIEHDDELRTRHYLEKDKLLSNRENLTRIFRRHCSSLEEIPTMLADPTIKRLLGAGLQP